MKYTNEYVAPTLTVDLVLFQIIDNELCVLLMKRPNEPFKGVWALPGGYNPQGETTLEALNRIVSYKVGIDIYQDIKLLEQLYTFDVVARDPRGHAVSVTYMGCCQNLESDQSPNKTTWFPVNNLPTIAYDHTEIIRYAHKRISSRITYTNAAFAFLNDNFTLTELQLVYEAIFGRKLDKRNFRKKFLSLDLIVKTNLIQQKAAHRPASLYKFRSNSIQELERSFE
jgi:8-oxo-dGTP diphosphatase